MSEEKPPEAPIPEVQVQASLFPQGHDFPVEILSKWIEIPYNEPVFIGPLTRADLDHLLFSFADLASAVADLRNSLITYSNGDKVSANNHLTNSMNRLVDGQSRNRLLFEAIMKSVIEVRQNAGK